MSIPQVTKPYTHVNNTKADGNKVNANDDTAFAGVNLAIGAINQAAGAKNSLKERLDILLNQDGTPRSGVTAGGEWANPDLGPQYVSATQFTVAGDHSDIYHQRRRLNINDGAAFATISSASFNGGTGLTTITITESVLTDPISKVEHGIINMQEDLSSIGFSEAAHPNRGVMRDSAGRAKVVAPAVDSDIALLSTLKLYGIGRDADGNQVTNLDTLFTTGIYPVSTTATGTPTSGSSGAVIVARAGAGGRVSQLFMSYVNSRMYRRDWQGAAWDDWMRVVMGVPSSATSTSTNAITDLSHTHAIDSTIARSAIGLTAGNGLTGGGDLSANRTLTMGTPGTLTAATTNGVTASSHTHAIDATTSHSDVTAGRLLRGEDLAAVSQAEAEAGTATTNRRWTALRVRQAIQAVIGAIGWGTNNAGGNFTSGNIRWGRILGIVTIGWSDLGHASASSATSAAGIVPAAFRPDQTFRTLMWAGSGIFAEVTISTAGTVAVNYRNSSGTSVNATSLPGGSLSFVLPYS
jgi:hypothetical protein